MRGLYKLGYCFPVQVDDFFRNMYVTLWRLHHYSQTAKDFQQKPYDSRCCAFQSKRLFRPDQTRTRYSSQSSSLRPPEAYWKTSGKPDLDWDETPSLPQSTLLTAIDHGNCLLLKVGGVCIAGYMGSMRISFYNC
jgi:hypothetical protein